MHMFDDTALQFVAFEPGLKEASRTCFRAGKEQGAEVGEVNLFTFLTQILLTCTVFTISP